MLDPTRDDDEFALFNPFFAVAGIVTIIHAETALHDHEHLVFIFMMMPGERALKLNQLYHLPIKFAGDARIPVIVDERKLLREIYLMHNSETAAPRIIKVAS